MRPLLILVPALLAGCISFSSTKAPGAPSSPPDYTGFCKEKELLCRDMCAGTGVQTFSCKATPSEGLDYQCQCKKPGAAL
jgi:hypothetical protein